MVPRRGLEPCLPAGRLHGPKVILKILFHNHFLSIFHAAWLHSYT